MARVLPLVDDDANQRQDSPDHEERHRKQDVAEGADEVVVELRRVRHDGLAD